MPPYWPGSAPDPASRAPPESCRARMAASLVQAELATRRCNACEAPASGAEDLATDRPIRVRVAVEGLLHFASSEAGCRSHWPAPGVESGRARRAGPVGAAGAPGAP